jgi:hypothetical protein
MSQFQSIQNILSFISMSAIPATADETTSFQSLRFRVKMSINIKEIASKITTIII